MISLASDMTDSKGRHARGWLFFDAECEFCRTVAACLAPRLYRLGLAAAPLQDPRVSALLALPRAELLRTLRYVTPERQFCGADAVLALAAEIWWLRPLLWLAKIPGALPVLRATYDWHAGRRRCNAQICSPVKPRGLYEDR